MLSSIILRHVWQIFLRIWAFLVPIYPWAVPKRPNLNRVKIHYNKPYMKYVSHRNFLKNELTPKTKFTYTSWLFHKNKHSTGVKNKNSISSEINLRHGISLYCSIVLTLICHVTLGKNQSPTKLKLMRFSCCLDIPKLQ